MSNQADRVGIAAIDSGQVPSLWHGRGRWGHRMHSMCSYFAMLPNSTVNVLVQWLSEPGDVVYDPFSGSGKVPLESRRLGRYAVGSDLNPLAVCLTRAKLAAVSTETVLERLAQLEEDCDGARPRLNTVPAHIRMIFSDFTLGQLLALRRRLDVRRDEDALIMATILGIMHLNALSDGTPRGLTASMPNTFAMSPGYVGRYIEHHGLIPPHADVFEKVHDRLKVLDPGSIRGAAGATLRRDATHRAPADIEGRVKLLLSSPPYLNVIKYAKFNWIRLWMLGYEPKTVDRRLMASSSIEKYVSFLCATLKAQASAMHEQGLACLVIGDVTRGEETLRLAEIAASAIEERAGWQRLAVVADELPQDRKVSRIWGQRKGLATKTDRLLIMRPPGGVAGLPPVPAIDWSI